MSTIDADALVAEISPDAPCGEDLEYDAAFGELERSARGKEEQQIGDTIVEAEEPEWKTVKQNALALFPRTKDIRVTLYLLRASLHLDGYQGLHDGLRLLLELLKKYWEHIHPQLDAEDNNDPTMRINALMPLDDDQALLNPLRKAPLVSSRVMGQFSLRSLAIANGDLQPSDSSDQVELSAVNAAFMEVEVEELKKTADAIAESIEYSEAIDGLVTAQVGAAESVSFNDLTGILKEARQVLSDQLALRGVETEGDSVEGDSAAAGQASGTPKQALSGTINNREDVIRALDKIKEYYSRNEPSSPVPLLMERAKKLVSMDFMEIIQNLAPDGITQVENIRGPEDNQ
jgi:type VI secretion system protein ImpA